MKKTNALVLIDLQNDFVTGSLGSQEAQAIMAHISEKVKNFDGQIILTKDTHQTDYLDTPEGRNLPIVHCIARTTGHDLAPEIQKALEHKEYTVIEKPTFGSLDLMHRLQKEEKRLNRVEIMGLVTDICVISNALLLKAALPDTEIIVDSAGCAGTTPSNHKAALDVMQSCQIKII